MNAYDRYTLPKRLKDIFYNYDEWFMLDDIETIRENVELAKIRVDELIEDIKKERL